MLGYCWNATDYPWIHYWIHEENNHVLYRGLEFGTAPLHLNWQELFDRHDGWFRERPTCFYLHPGEAKTFRYHFFLKPIPSGCNQIEQIETRRKRRFMRSFLRFLRRFA